MKSIKILAILLSNSSDWIFESYIANHTPTGISLWTGNGFRYFESKKPSFKLNTLFMYILYIYINNVQRSIFLKSLKQKNHV